MHEPKWHAMAPAVSGDDSEQRAPYVLLDATDTAKPADKTNVYAVASIRSYDVALWEYPGFAV